MPNFIRTTLHPENYHGHHARPPFFEGWYFKSVSADGRQRIAVIPGVFLGENGHAFIQVLDGANRRADYVSFPLTEFWASAAEFEIRIAGNHFNTRGFSLDVDTSLGSVRGALEFDGVNPWPVTLTSPGIMGWYAWVPRMECYHGVLSFDHAIEGALAINGETLDFSGGRGYIEKDWGQAFPEGYIWFQSNHFQTDEFNPSLTAGHGLTRASTNDQTSSSPGRVSLTASVAIIPWIGHSFRGHIVGLWIDGVLYRFATYTGADIEVLSLSDEKIDWTIWDKRCRLHMTVHRAPGSIILGPTRMEMGVRVDETISATLTVHLSTLDGRTIYAGTGQYAGLEVQGDLERLLAM